jgi:hypothetical protein
VIEGLDVHSAAPYSGGHGYEWVRATARFAADPTKPGNRRITDLAHVRTDDGLVRFDADVRLLRPSEGGNGKLLFVVSNRGLLGGVPFSLGAPAFGVPSEELDPGDGFLLEQGWTVAWCGWQHDVLPGEGKVGIRVPDADVEPGWTRLEWRPDAAHDDHALSDSAFIFTFTDQPTVDVEDPDAVLTWRVAPDGERHVVPREQWRFTDATHVALDGQFQPFHWYELVYRTAPAPVAGCGLLAVRDLVADLRQDHDHAFAWGVSQSGRFLRQFLWEGLNVDESGRQVFDGVFAHIAGGRRGEFNARYGHASFTHVIGWSNPGPYDTAALLERQASVGGLPKLFQTNTAWEYWRGDGALVHVDAATGGDLPEPEGTRTYLLSGTDHIGAMPMKDLMPVANPVHKLDTGPILRALFTALDRWVCHDEEPPPSQVPRWNDGTASWRSDVLERFRHVPTPDLDVLNVTRPVDLGPDADRGIGRFPVKLGTPVPAVVADVDEDGNEVAGIRLPELAAPVAAFTGWNPRRHVEGLPDVLYEFVGSRVPFLPDRPTLAERYGDRVGYREAARRSAEALVAGGYLLDRDVEVVVANALQAWDEVDARGRNA